jgi:short-subunit dehydrogenase
MRARLKPLHEQVMVITGASSGIGLATAEMAAEAGAAVMLVARDEDTLRAVRDRLRAAGHRAECAVADVGRLDEVESALAATIEAFGGLDTWVNNAGVGVYSDLLEISREDHERVFQTNYWGVVNGTQVAARYLLRHGGGAIINIGSVLSDLATTPLGAYSATKHAVKGFTDAFRMEMIQRGAPVSVTLVKPSGINSPWSDHARNYRGDRARVPPMVYAPETVARTVLFAAAHPRRDIVVGSSGALLVGFSRLLPRTADRLYAWVLPRLSFDHSRPSVPGDDLYSPAENGHRSSDHRLVRKHSLHTAMQRHRLLTWTAIALAGTAVFLVLRRRRRQAAPPTLRARLAALPLLASTAAALERARGLAAAGRHRSAAAAHRIAGRLDGGAHALRARVHRGAAALRLH